MQPFSAANCFLRCILQFFCISGAALNEHLFSNIKIRTLTRIGLGFGFAVYMPHNGCCFINFTAVKLKVFIIYSHEIASHPLPSFSFAKIPQIERDLVYFPYVFHEWTAMCIGPVKISKTAFLSTFLWEKRNQSTAFSI